MKNSSISKKCEEKERELNFKKYFGGIKLHLDEHRLGMNQKLKSRVMKSENISKHVFQCISDLMISYKIVHTCFVKLE